MLPLEGTLGHEFKSCPHTRDLPVFQPILSPIDYNFKKRKLMVLPNRVRIYLLISTSMARFPMGDVMKLDALRPVTRISCGEQFQGHDSFNPEYCL